MMEIQFVHKKDLVNKYRLCFVETAEQIGGGQVGLLDILENLDYDLFEPWVVLTSSKSEFYDKLSTLNHVRIAVTPFTSFLPKKWCADQDFPLYSPLGVYLLKNFFKKLRPDLIHSNHLPAGKYGVKAAKLCNIPNIVTMRCMYYKRKFYFNRFVERRIHKNADCVVFNSIRGTELFQERTAAKNVVSIINGIRLERFSKNDDVNIFTKFGIPENKKLLLLPSRIYPLKGHRELIKAVSILINKIPEIHIVFLGDEDTMFPGSKSDFTLLASRLGLSRNISWIDFQEDVVPFFKNAFCTVLPSYTEGFPRVLLESLAAGTPILGSRIDGINEILEEGVNGFGFEPKNSESLSQAIEKLLALTSEEYQKMKNQCLRIAREKYDIKVMIHKYQELYLKLIQSDCNQLLNHLF